jgi:CDGSH-type Zn-finger protein
MVRIDATGPIKIEPAAFPRDEQGNLKPIWICACGLSQTLPLCDGAHKACRAAEQPGVLYTYDKDRKTVIESRLESP